ncbi:MAG: cysteine desulfurase [Parachlamydiaceae bacterium]|nr:cysteine desulfurase [Parachlamydiaceae bacterium]
MKQRIYLDHNASTPLDPNVLEVVVDELKEGLGNPSSIHYYGQRCRQKLEASRETIAKYLKVKSNELIFTSGGTEGANLLIKGILNSSSKSHVITSNAEHSCVYNTLKYLEDENVTVSFLPTGIWGAVTPEAVLDNIRPETRLITLMAVNNETGVKTDIAAIAAIAEKARIPFVVDGVSLLGKENFTIPSGVSAMFFSGHKLHAPKGVGVVYCKRSVKFEPLITGAGQEFNHRAGSENLPGIVGLAKAIELLSDNQEQYTAYMLKLRNKFEEGLKAYVGNIVINGQAPRVASTSNISFLGVDGESLLMNLDMEGLSVSHGSACSSGAIEPSRILLNMGIPLAQVNTAIRFSISRMTTEEEIDRALAIITNLIKRMRELKK